MLRKAWTGGCPVSPIYTDRADFEMLKAYQTDSRTDRQIEHIEQTDLLTDKVIHGGALLLITIYNTVISTEAGDKVSEPGFFFSRGFETF